MSARTMISALLALLLALAPSGAVRTDEPRRGRPNAEAPAEAKRADEEKSEEKEDEEKDHFLAITGGTVHTVTGPQLEGVTILCKNGRIHAIGREIEIPEKAERIDASGHHVYPGLIALSSSGLVGYGDPEVSTDVYDLELTLGLAGGLTTVVAGTTAAKLTHGTLDGLILRRNLLESISYSTRSPSSRARFREALDRVREHLRALERYDDEKKRDPEAKKPDEKWIRGPYSTAMRLLKKEAIGRATANDAGDITALARLAGHYGFRLVIQGATEGWTVPRELASAGVAAIITPRSRRDRDERLVRPNGSSIEMARILHEHGVPFGIVPPSSFISTWGLAGRDLLHLPMEAAHAIRGGLPEQAALEAITIQAARILGLDHRIGSIEEGKDADFAISDGPILSYLSHVRWTVVNGRVAYDKAKDSLFDHIRPGGDFDAPPPPDHWPRSLGEEW